MAQRVNIEVLNKAAVDVTVQNSNAINVEVPTAPRGLGAPFTANKTEIDEGAVVDFTATNPGFEYLFSIEDVNGFINKLGKSVSHQFLDSGSFDVALTQADLNQQASGIQIKRDFIKVNEVEFILNTFSGATAAYSIRKLERSVTKAVRVREDGSNTETDIGFVDGELDETELLNHVGSNNGFVTKWYDQSGNGNDASNSTASGQPQIVNSGSVIKENGKPALDFDGIDDALQLSKDISNTVSSYSFITVFNDFKSDTFKLDIENPRLVINNPENFTFFDGDQKGSGFPLNSQILAEIFLNKNNNTGDSYKNGSPFETGLAYSPRKAELSIAIGARFNLSRSFADMRMQELLIYNENKSSNRTSIETNINNHYSIF